MCRDDRRCPGQNCTKAREAHNRRRRDNRKIKKNIEAWAGNEENLDFNDVKGKPADQLKIWAKDHGAPAEVLLAGTYRPGVDVQNDNLHRPAPEPFRDGGMAGGFAGGGAGLGGGGRGGMGGGRGGISGDAGDPVQGGNKEPLTLCGITVSDSDRKYVEPVKDQIQALVDVQTSSGTWQEGALLRRGETIRIIGEGVNTTKKIKIGRDDEHGYFKPFSDLDHSTAAFYGQDKALQPIHEAAAWQFAKTMGPEYAQLVSPCIIREVDGQLGSVSYGQSGRVSNNTGIPLSDLPKDQVNNLAFYDALIGQQDRHGGNFIVDNRGVVGIDHGFTFARNRDRVNASKFQRYRKQREPELAQNEFQLLIKITKSDDCLGMKKIIGAKRADSLKRRAEAMLKSGKIL
ncbi:hypothetical protein [Glutamicibacter sp. NPDC127525]|uniref:hypothetical protein n=1 Tax=unclassified Glutamicibacter TaxID=2627139 RepID=UPI003632C44E